MSINTKTLIFTLDPTFSGSCELTLGFMPEGAFENVYPIAWKVFKLSALTGSQTVVWNDNLAGSRAIVGKNNSVTVEEFIAVPPGHTTDLILDTSIPSKPVWKFTPTTRFGDRLNTQSRVMNQSPQVIDQFGTGFAVTDSSGKETMNAVLITDSVKPNEGVFIDYVPHLKVWANTGYKQSEILDRAVATLPVVWEADLSELEDQRIKIKIGGKATSTIEATTDNALSRIVGTRTRSNTTVSRVVRAVNVGFDNLEGRYYEAVYTAHLTFALPALVSEGLRAIIEGLSTVSYTTTKTVSKGYDTEASLTLTLRPNGNCSEAEQDVINALRNANVYGRAFIKAHSGAICVAATNSGRETWMEINPASPQWFGAAYGRESFAFNGVANAEAYAAQVHVVEGNNGRHGGRN